MALLPADPYWTWLKGAPVPLPAEALWQARRLLRDTPLTQPETPAHWNNVGALLLARALSAGGDDAPGLVERAAQAFVRAAFRGCPQAAAHLSVCEAVRGPGHIPLTEPLRRLNAAALAPTTAAPPTLVVLPTAAPLCQDGARFAALVAEGDGAAQALTLHAAALELARPFPLDAAAHGARRLAHTAALATPDLRRQLALVEAARGEVHGVLTLKALAEATPADRASLHALSLLSRRRGEGDPWRTIAQGLAIQGDPAWAFAAAPGDHTLLPYDGGLIAAPADLTNLSTLSLLLRGDWFEGEIPLWRALCRPGARVIDVGANVGVYTLSAARRVGPDGRVLAVEAGAEAARLLRIGASHLAAGNTTVVEAAASNAPGEGWLSAGPPELRRLMSQRAPGAQPVRRVTVDGLAAQHLAGPVDLMKIDVEGHELAVLQGALGVLERHRPTVLYESARPGGHNVGAALFLRGRGYRLYGWNPHLRRLDEVDAEGDLSPFLNLVALPEGRGPAELGLG